MLDRTDDSSVAADTWLAQFEEALAKPDEVLLHQLFHPDSYWRDVLALIWNIQTLNVRDAIMKALAPLARSAGPSDFAIAPDRDAVAYALDVSEVRAVLADVHRSAVDAGPCTN